MAVDSWSIYQRRLNQNGSSQKDRLIANTQRIMTDQFLNNPSYQVVIINGISQEVQINNESFLSKNPNKKHLLCKPNEDISIGDLVIWDSENWLCTDIDDNGIYVRGIIEKCNNNLKYLSNIGALITVPCIITDKISMNTKENSYYMLPENKIWVIVDSNSDTTPITVDQRFLLGGNAYKVENPDNITKPGLITFKMSFDSIVEDDNKTLGIANYTSRSHTYSITILNGSDTDITLGNNLQLEFECKDNFEVVTSPDVVYSLVTGSTGVISVSASGVVSGAILGSGNIIATYASATDIINIDIVANIINNFTYSLIGNIQPDNEVKYNQTKSYNAYKYYHTGSIVTGAQFEFTVILGTGASSSNYLLTTSSDTTFTLKGLQYPFDISLIGQDIAIPTNTIAKVISLKGLI